LGQIAPAAVCAGRLPGRIPGPDRDSLPKWADIQFVVGQLHKLPLLDEETVGTGLVIGSRAAKPLHLEIPLFLSDMSFGALSEEAKVALSKGAELAQFRDLTDEVREKTGGIPVGVKPSAQHIEKDIDMARLTGVAYGGVTSP
jgi:hypothetical protein